MHKKGFLGGALAFRLLRLIAPLPTQRDESGDCDREVKLERYFPPEFLTGLNGKTLIDFGCGDGLQAVTLALRIPDCRIIGLDIQTRMLRRAEARARKNGVADRCVFTQATDERADVILSIDAFEHFSDPADILESMSALLKPNGEVMISFGPTWFHPYGGHLFSVFPWAHLIFSEPTLLRWRSQFRSDGARSFSDVEGGLNQMLISEFVNLVERSSLQVDWLETVPVRQWKLFRYKPLREFGSSIVRCRLVHACDIVETDPEATGELAV